MPLSKVTETGTNIKPKIVVYGPEKIGKSTFAAGAPKPIYIPTEAGLKFLRVSAYPKAESFNDVMDYLAEIAAEDHDYQTVVIDTTTCLERLIQEQVVKSDGVESIVMAGGGYGKGYEMVSERLRNVLTGLDYLNESRDMGVILIAHATSEKFTDPEHGQFERWQLRGHKSFTAQIIEWADAVFFARKKTALVEDKQGKKVLARLAKGVGRDGGNRVLLCEGTPAIVAGNRFGLRGELPLEWNAFQEALESALNPESETENG